MASLPFVGQFSQQWVLDDAEGVREACYVVALKISRPWSRESRTMVSAWQGRTDSQTPNPGPPRQRHPVDLCTSLLLPRY